MFATLVRFSTYNWKLIVACTAVFAAIAFSAFRQLPIEAYPDVTDPMVEVVTVFPGQSAEETERQISLELERVLAGTPNLKNIRTVSIFGLSVVTLRFDDDSNERDNRIFVAERLREAELPDGVEALIGPDATPVGQIYRYTLEGPRPLRELRSIQDWVIERHLGSVPGVAEVVTFGGFEKQYAVRIDPIRLSNMGVTVAELFRALEESNQNAGGGYVGIGNQEFILRGVGVVREASELGNTLVAYREDRPIRVRDVADIFESSVPRRGSVGRNHQDEVVEGIVLLRRGENPERVLEGLEAKVKELNDRILPADVNIVTFYDRRELTRYTLLTVGENLLHGAILVAVIVLFFLRSWAAALIVGCVIPLSLLTAFLGLRALGMSANLLSMGAIDFGILVENAAVILEVTLHGLFIQQATSPGPLLPHIRRQTITEAALLVARPITLAAVIIILALVPLFLLERVEGRIFKPMAYTYIFALIGGLLAALTIVPALAGLLLPKRLPRDEARWLRSLQNAYTRLLERARGRRWLVLGIAGAMALGAGLHARTIGSEFLPELNEGGLYITAVFPPTIALDETRRHIPEIRRKILDSPETDEVLSHLGRPEDATQTEGSNNVEFFVKLAPMKEWRRGFHLADIEDEIRESLREIPGVAFNFSQPITDRVFETISGIIGQVVVKVQGEDLDVLTDIAEEVKQRLDPIEGVADLSLYQAGNVPQISIELDRSRLAERGISVAEAQEVIEVALGGKVATEIWEGERRYGVALRLPESMRKSPEALGQLVVGDMDNRVLLSEVATIAPAMGRSMIWRENLSRFVAVKFNVRGRDLGSAVAEAQARVADMELPEGVSLAFGGEFENQQRAMGRLSVIVPLVLLAMLAVLYWNFGSIRPAVVIMGFLPISTIFAVSSLQAMGEHFSVSAAVGCITLLGQITLVGVLLCTRIDHEAKTGASDAAISGARIALRPVLLMACLAAIGLVPAALSQGMGSESQRPFAIAIIGGLITTVPLVLILLPLFYRPKIADSAKEEETMGAGQPSPAVAKAPASVVAMTIALVLTFPSRAEAQATEARAPELRQSSSELLSSPRDLDHLLARWLENGEEVASWRAEVGAARFDIVSARTLPNPELSIETAQTVAGETPDDLTVFGATLEIPLPIFGQVGARKRRAEQALSAAEAQLSMLIWERAAEIREGVLNLAFAKARIELTEAEIQELDRVQRIIEARSKMGFALGYDAMRVGLLRETLEVAAASARIEREGAESELIALIGDPSLSHIDIDREGLPRLQTIESGERLVSLAIERRPDIAFARRSQNVALAEVEELRKENIPSPSLFIGTEIGRQFNNTNIVGGLSFPLPLLDRNRGPIGRAHAEASAHRNMASALETRARSEILGALRALEQARRARDRFEAYRKSATTDVLERAWRAYEGGSFSITELLDALEAIWDARKESLEIEQAVKATELVLIRAAAL